MFGIPNFRDSEVFGTQGVRYGIPKAEFMTQKFGIPFFGTPCFRDSGGIPKYVMEMKNLSENCLRSRLMIGVW